MSPEDFYKKHKMVFCKVYRCSLKQTECDRYHIEALELKAQFEESMTLKNDKKNAWKMFMTKKAERLACLSCSQAQKPVKKTKHEIAWDLIKKFRAKIKGERIEAKICEYCGNIIFRQPEMKGAGWFHTKNHKICSKTKDRLVIAALKRIRIEENKILIVEQQNTPRECRYSKCDNLFVGHMNKKFCSDPCKTQHKCELKKEDRLKGKAKNMGKQIVPAEKDQHDIKQHERGSCLKKALDVINGERQSKHGTPEDSFQLIAEYWSAYLKRAGVMIDDALMKLSPRGVAEMMMLLKIARMSGQKPTIDNHVDLAGYAGIAGDMVEKVKI